MLNEQSKESLVSLGFDVDLLAKAFKSEEEVTIDLPQLYKDKGHTNDELTVFGNNRFKEGQSNNEEILAKTLHDEFGLNLPDGKEGRKNIKKVIEAYGEKRFKEAKPSDDQMELMNNFKTLQKQLEEERAAKEELKKASDAKLSELQLIQSLSSELPKETTISHADIVELYTNKRVFDTVDGRTVIKNKDGEIIKDTLLNPVSPIDDFKAFLDTGNYVVKKGMEGKDSKGGGSATKFSNAKDFMAWCEANGKEPLSDEMQRHYLANKAK